MAQSQKSQIIKKMQEIYGWLDEEIRQNARPDDCVGCGDCCRYKAFGHRIYVTTPEVLYFQHALEVGHTKLDIEKNSEKCPFLADTKCLARYFRFGPCRIFFCKGQPRWQNKLTEQFLSKIKQLCNDAGLKYRYIDIERVFLEMSNGGDITDN